MRTNLTPWRDRNRARYNATQRAYYAKRKAAGNPTHLNRKKTEKGK